MKSRERGVRAGRAALASLGLSHCSYIYWLRDPPVGTWLRMANVVSFSPLDSQQTEMLKCTTDGETL